MSEISEIHNDQSGEKRLSADYWNSHFRDKENSKLNQAEYFRRHGKYDTFPYWKQKLYKP